MMRRMRAMSWAAAMVLAWCGIARAAGGGAGPLDDRVPADALVYVGWAGSDALGPQYASSNLKGVLEASALPAFVTEHVAKLVEQAKANPNFVGPRLEKLQAALPMVWHHPTAFYFCPMDFANGQRPGMHFGFICDAGKDAAALVDLLNAVTAAPPPPPAPPVHVLQDGTVVVVTVGREQTIEEMKKGGGLAGTAAYRAAMEKVKQANPAIAIYGDISGVLAMAKEGLAATGAPPEVREKFPAVADALGISSMTQVAAVGGFDGAGWTRKAFVGVNGPKRGVLSLVDGAPISDAALASVPKESTVFSAWKLDFTKVLAEARTVMGKVSADLPKEFDKGLAEGSKALGVDIEKELLGAMGEEWVLYRGAISEDGTNSFALVQKLRDAETFARTMETLEKFYNAHVGAAAGGGLAMFRVEKMTTSKIPVSTIALGGASVAWTVRNGYLYVSTMEGIAGAVKQVENKGPSIVENELYQAARKGLPADARPISISYANPAKVYPELRRLVLGYIPIVRAMGIDVPQNLFPDPADVAQFMTPGMEIVWVDADGIHKSATLAFPGAALLSGQDLGPTALGMMGAGTVLFGVRSAQVQTTEVRSVDMANLRSISQSSMVYASDHKDQMPDELARLVADGMLSPRQLVSRRSGTAPLEFSAELQKLAKEDYAKFAEQLAAHNDFAYLGKGTKMDADASIILAYERPGPMTKDGLNVAFRDGHVEFMTWEALAGAFEATNAYLKKAGQPAVDVADLKRKAGVE